MFFSYLTKKSKIFIRNLFVKSQKKNRKANLRFFENQAKNKFKLTQAKSKSENPKITEFKYVEVNKLIMSAISDFQKKSASY